MPVNTLMHRPTLGLDGPQPLSPLVTACLQLGVHMRPRDAGCAAFPPLDHERQFTFDCREITAEGGTEHAFPPYWETPGCPLSSDHHGLSPQRALGLLVSCTEGAIPLREKQVGPPFYADGGLGAWHETCGGVPLTFTRLRCCP